MKIKHSILFLIPIFLLSNVITAQIPSRDEFHQKPRLGKSTIDDYWHYHNVGNLGLSVTNYGVIGEGYTYFTVKYMDNIVK